MKIGCVKEIKAQEFRVGLTPSATKEAILHGHTVYIEKFAGIGSGFEDDEYLTSARASSTPPTKFSKPAI